MRVTLIAIIISLTIPVTVSAESCRPYFITKYAKLFNIDPDLLLAFCSVESRCRSKAINHNDGTKRAKKLKLISKSYGMFQIKLATARGLGFKDKDIVKVKKNHKWVIKVIDHTKDLLNPEVNTYYAAKLIRQLYNKYYKTIKVISAYNAGKYSTYNHKYVDKVLHKYITLKLDKRKQ